MVADLTVTAMLTPTMEVLFFCLHISNDPDPAAGATSQWRRLKWAAPTKGKSSPDWKFLLVGAEDEMSLVHLLKRKQARQLEAEVGVCLLYTSPSPRD